MALGKRLRPEDQPCELLSVASGAGFPYLPANRFTEAALFSQVGLDWQLGGGFAVDSPSGSIASMGNSSQVAQLVQAMAGFGGSSGAVDGLNACPSRYLHIVADVADDAAATWTVIELLKKPRR